jgi:hypothetical protein
MKDTFIDVNQTTNTRQMLSDHFQEKQKRYFLKTF